MQWADAGGATFWERFGIPLRSGLAILLGGLWPVVVMIQYPGDRWAGWCLLAPAIILGVLAFIRRSPLLTVPAIMQVLMMHGLYFFQARPEWFARQFPAMTIVLAVATLGLGAFADKAVVHRHAHTRAI